MDYSAVSISNLAEWDFYESNARGRKPVIRRSSARQRLGQDVPCGIYVRILCHPALDAVISFALPVTGRDSSASGAPLRREHRVNQHQLAFGTQTRMSTVMGMLLDGLEVDHAASEFVSGSILSGQSVLVSSNQLHSERRENASFCCISLHPPAIKECGAWGKVVYY